MGKTVTRVAVLMFAATSAFGQAPTTVLYDDDGYPFQLLAMPGEAPDMVTGDDDGNPIELLSLDITPPGSADRSSIASTGR